MAAAAEDTPQDGAPPRQQLGISTEWIKVVAESVGICASADELAYRFLADDVSFRIKNIIQDAVKLSHHCKRTNLTTHDIDYTLKMKHYEPLYGFTSSDYIPFRNASGGGRDLHFTDDQEIDLDELSTKALPKIPLNTSLKAHWLAIEGVQPAIPENPPPLSRESQKLESINPAVKASMDKQSKLRSASSKKSLKDVKLKPLTEHDLSVEQQLYYKEITEACVGAHEERRVEALNSLAHDPGLHKMLPRLCTFISEGVKVNAVQSNLAILIYILRMFKALLDNDSLYLEKYLHELIPATITCVVSKQLGIKPETDNHWALRTFAAKILARLCSKFSSTTNDIQTRIIKLLNGALHNPKAPLATHFGCISAMSELGPGVIRSFVVPAAKAQSEKIRMLIEPTSVSSADRAAGQHVRAAFVNAIAPYLKLTRQPPDLMESYREEFGYLGSFFCDAVIRARGESAGLSGSSLLYASGGSTATRGSLATQRPRTVLNTQQASAVSRSYSLPSGVRSSVLPSPIIRMSGAGGTSLVRTPTTPNTPGNSSQRFIIMSSGSTTTQQPSSTNPTIVKVVSAIASSGTSQVSDSQHPLGRSFTIRSKSGEDT